MTKRISFQMALIAAFIVVISLGFASRIWAQSGSKYVFENADVRQALRELFKSVNVSYSISPDVQGTVTIDIQNVTLETALQNILRQVDATYRIEGGVYEIIRHGETRAPALVMGSQTFEPEIPRTTSETAMTQDSKFLYVVQGERLFKVQKSDLAIVETGLLGGVISPKKAK